MLLSTQNSSNVTIKRLLTNNFNNNNFILSPKNPITVQWTLQTKEVFYHSISHYEIEITFTMKDIHN